MLTIRIGTWILTAHGVAITIAAILFIVISAIDTLKQPWGSIRNTTSIVLMAAIIAALGAVMYGLPETLTSSASGPNVRGLHGLSFGSLGGFWGALIGSAIGARLIGCPLIKAMDCIVPALFFGGAIARTSGITDLQWKGTSMGNLPNSLWSTADALVLLALCICVTIRRAKVPGDAILIYLLAYGVLRFSLEFLRVAESRIGIFTWGQILCVVQFMFGLFLLRFRLRHTYQLLIASHTRREITVLDRKMRNYSSILLALLSRSTRYVSILLIWTGLALHAASGETTNLRGMEQSQVHILPTLSRPSVKNGELVTVGAIIKSPVKVSRVVVNFGGVETVALKPVVGGLPTKSDTSDLGATSWSADWKAHGLEEKIYSVRLVVTDEFGNETVDESLRFSDPAAGFSSPGSPQIAPLSILSESYFAQSSNFSFPMVDEKDGFVYTLAAANGKLTVYKFATGMGSSTPTSVGSASVAIAGRPSSAVIDAGQNAIYVGTDSRPGRVYKFATGNGTASPRFVGSCTLLQGEDDLHGAILDGQGWVYFGTRTKPGRIVVIDCGFDQGAPTRLGSVALDSGEDYIVGCMGALPNGEYFGEGCFITETKPAKIVRVQLSGTIATERIDRLSLATGEDYVTSCAVDEINGYGYLGVRTGAGQNSIVKIGLNFGFDQNNQPQFRRIGALALSNSSVSGLSINAKAGYGYASLIGDSQLVKFKLGAANAIPELGAFARIAGSGDYYEQICLDARSGYGYLTSQRLGLAKISLGLGEGPPAQTNDLLTLPPNETQLRVAVTDSAAKYAYFATNDSPAQIIKVELSPTNGTAPRRVGSISLMPGEEQISCGVVNGNAAYFATATSPAKVIKLVITSGETLPQRVGTLTLEPGEDNIRCALVSKTRKHLYFGTSTKPGLIVKVDEGGLWDQCQRLGFVKLPQGDDYIHCGVLDGPEEYGYFGTFTSPGRVVKVWLGGRYEWPEKINELSLSVGEDFLNCATADPVSGSAIFGAFGGNGALAGRIIKVKMTSAEEAPVRVGVALLDGAQKETQPTGAVADTDRGYAYILTAGQEARLIKIRIGEPNEAPVRLASSQMPDTMAQATSAVIDAANDLIYVGAYRDSGRVFKLRGSTADTTPPSLASRWYPDQGGTYPIFDDNRNMLYTVTSYIPTSANQSDWTSIFNQYDLNQGADPPTLARTVSQSKSRADFGCLDEEHGVVYYGTSTPSASLSPIVRVDFSQPQGSAALASVMTNSKYHSVGPDRLVNNWLFARSNTELAKYIVDPVSGELALSQAGDFSGIGGRPSPLAPIVNRDTGRVLILTNTADFSGGTPRIVAAEATGNNAQFQFGMPKILAQNKNAIGLGPVFDATRSRVLFPVRDARGIDPDTLGSVGWSGNPAESIGDLSEYRVAWAASPASDPKGSRLPGVFEAKKIRGVALSKDASEVFVTHTNSAGDCYLSRIDAMAPFNPTLPITNSVLLAPNETLQALDSANDVKYISDAPAHGYLYASDGSRMWRLAKTHKGMVKGTEFVLSEIAEVTDVRMYSHKASGNIRLAIYQLRDGHQQLVWQSGSIANSKENDWIICPASAGTPTSLKLTAGTYSIAWQSDSTENVGSYISEPTRSYTFPAAFGDFPSSIRMEPGESGTYFLPSEMASVSSGGWSAYFTYKTVPSITSTTPSQLVSPNQSVTLTVNVSSDAPVTYQWFRYGQPIVGATGATYVIPAVTTATAGEYTCQITNSSGITETQVIRVGLTSFAIILHPVSQVVNPKPQSVLPNVEPSWKVKFRVDVTNPADCAYQWRKNGVNISGATQPTLEFDAKQGDDGDYTCRATFTGAGVVLTSNPAHLTVTGPPTISTQPQDLVVIAGESATFSVTASGPAPISYFWNFVGGLPPPDSDINMWWIRQWITQASGGTLRLEISETLKQRTMTIPSVTIDDEGDYECIVSNYAGDIHSRIVHLTVIEPPKILSRPHSLTAVPGTPFRLEVLAKGTAPLTYQWQKNGVNIGGATLSVYAVGSASEADQATYRCLVTNAAGDVTTKDAIVDVMDPPEITLQPQSISEINPYVSYYFALRARGSGPLTYQWKKNGTALQGATLPKYSGNAQESDEGSYVCVVSNAAGSVASQPVTLTVRDVAVGVLRQSESQPDPAGTLPIRFDIDFNKPVSGFSLANIVCEEVSSVGSVGLSMSGSGTHYQVSVDSAENFGMLKMSMNMGGIVDEFGVQPQPQLLDNTVQYRDVKNKGIPSQVLVGSHTSPSVTKILGAATRPKVGDINGDGQGDIIISKEAEPVSGDESDAIAVYFGIRGSEPIWDVSEHEGRPPDVKILGLGSLVLPDSLDVGDVNGDKIDDIAICGKAPSGGEKLCAFVILGRSTLPSTINLANNEADVLIRFSLNVVISSAHLEDWNGDGIDDLSVSVPELLGRKLWVLYGGISLPSVVDFGEGGGQSAAIINAVQMNSGDFNGDGCVDLLLSDTGFTQSGDVYILYGESRHLPPQLFLGDNSSGVRFTRIFKPGAQLAGETTGTAVGDLNGDGFDDFVIGVATDDANGMAGVSATGAVYIIFGGQDLPADFDITASSSRQVSIYGHSASEKISLGGTVEVGDVNGDGTHDLVVGSVSFYADDFRATGPPEYANLPTGRIWIMNGRADWGQTPIFLSPGETGTSYADGVSMLTVQGGALLADVNADGLMDLVGAGYRPYWMTTSPYNGIGYPWVDVWPGDIMIMLGSRSIPSFFDLSRGSADVNIKAGIFDRLCVYTRFPSTNSEDQNTVDYLFRPDSDSDSRFVGWDAALLHKGYYGADGAQDIIAGSRVSNYSALIRGWDVAESAEVSRIDAPGNSNKKDYGACRVSIDFDAGTNTSLTSIKLQRNRPSTNGIAAVGGVYWIFDTNRTNFGAAAATFKYLDSEIAGLDEAALKLFYRNSEVDPWQPVPFQTLDVSRNIVTTLVSGPGQFALGVSSPLEVLNPLVSISPAIGQSDPSESLPIVFDVKFTSSVTGFELSDIVLGGTALNPVAQLVGGGDSYQIKITTLGSRGTVTVNIPGSVCVDAQGRPNIALTPYSNSVEYRPRCHSADIDCDQRISADELGRVVAFRNAGGLHSISGGFAPGTGDTSGSNHDSDFLNGAQPGHDWIISDQELERVVSYYKAGAYIVQAGTPDGFAPKP